ncbi:MAG: SIS domain-containing protein [Erysipelotrichaceae bacterium]|nr:SIS domain-containing protein [Erysipelotrichaceae bacterium]
MITITRRPSIYTTIEKQDGYAKILVALYDVSECNIVLITSNSRRNAYPVEMVIEAKKKGAKVICIINLKHSSATSSRHSSGQKLYEVSDVVIDNCSEVGDAVAPVEGTDAIIYPTSSIANTFICASINGEV